MKAEEIEVVTETLRRFGYEVQSIKEVFYPDRDPNSEKHFLRISACRWPALATGKPPATGSSAEAAKP
jgi:hypothetical protein